MATLKEQIAALQKGWSAEIANQEQPGIQTDIKTGSLSFDNKNWMVFQYPNGGVTVMRRSPNQAGLGANTYRAEILDPETGKVEETVVSPSRIADIGGKVLLATMAVLAANPQLAASLGGAEAAAAAAGELAGADLAIALGEGIQPIASTAAQAGAVGSNLASLGAGIGLAGAAPGLLSTIGGALSAVPTSALVTGGLLAANAVSNALQPRQTTDAAGNVTYNLPPQMQFQGREYTPATGNLYRYGFGPEQAMFRGTGPTSTIGRTSVTPGVTQVAAPAAGSPLATQSLAQQGMTPSGLLAANVNGQQVPIVQTIDQATAGLLNQGVQVTQPQALTRDLAATIFQGFFDRAPTEQEVATFAQYGDRFKTPAEFSTFLMNSPQYQAYRDSLLAARNQPVAPAGGGTTQTVVQQAGGNSPTIVNAPMDMGLLGNESVVSGAGAPAFSGGLFTAMPTTNYITNDQAIDVFKSLTGYAPTQEQVAAFSGANTFTSPDAFRAFLTGTPDYQFMAAQGMLPSMNGLLQTR